MAESITSDVQRVEENMANAFVGNKFLPSVRLATESLVREAKRSLLGQTRLKILVHRI